MNTDEDDDYLTPIFDINWSEIRTLFRKETIEKIYGNLGQSIGINKKDDN